MGRPPSSLGSVHPTVIDRLPPVAVGDVGAPGTVVSGVADTAGEDCADWPSVFTAVTTQKYWVPSVSPLTNAEAAVAPLAVAFGVPDVEGELEVEQYTS
jgi:hypothetical protein